MCGRRLAFVEAKYHDTFETTDNSITHTQANRIATATEQWAGARQAYSCHSLVNSIYILPCGLLRHSIEGLQV